MNICPPFNVRGEQQHSLGLEFEQLALMHFIKPLLAQRNTELFEIFHHISDSKPFFNLFPALAKLFKAELGVKRRPSPVVVHPTCVLL